jgi:predicted nucleotidyltransferase
MPAAANPLNKIKLEIVRAINPERIVLFGSRARGRVIPSSDYDLLVVAKMRGSSSERIRRIHRAISNRGVNIDIIVRSPAELEKSLQGRDWFIQEIIKHGETLYASPTSK